MGFWGGLDEIFYNSHLEQCLARGKAPANGSSVVIIKVEVDFSISVE